MASDKNRRIVENYDEIARLSPLDILASGRYVLNGFGYPARLGRYLAALLELDPKDRVLDAGCNVGIYHDALARKALSLTGLDASPAAIERARAGHAQLKNADYVAADLTALKEGELTHRFEKIVCYSVVHFLEGVGELESLVGALAAQLEGRKGIVLLGEVRDRALYEAFRQKQAENRGPSLRDLVFRVQRTLSGWFMPKTLPSPGIAPTLFTQAEIEQVAAKLGARCERIPQDPWHPFYNTCVDYRLRF